MIVLRVEPRNNPKVGGIRPYDLGHDWSSLPSPTEDQGIRRRMRPGECCGALPHQFQRWWPHKHLKWAEFLEDCDAHIVSLDVPDELCTVGHNQVLFTRLSPDVRIVRCGHYVEEVLQ